MILVIELSRQNGRVGVDSCYNLYILTAINGIKVDMHHMFMGFSRC